jgi:hypothetical protein
VLLGLGLGFAVVVLAGGNAGAVLEQRVWTTLSKVVTEPLRSVIGTEPARTAMLDEPTLMTSTLQEVGQWSMLMEAGGNQEQSDSVLRSPWRGPSQPSGTELSLPCLAAGSCGQMLRRALHPVRRRR